MSAELFDIVVRMDGLDTFAREPKHCVDVPLGRHKLKVLSLPRILARLRGFEPSAAGGAFAFVPELRCGQALTARIRSRLGGASGVAWVAVASRVVAVQGLQSSTCSESAKTG